MRILLCLILGLMLLPEVASAQNNADWARIGAGILNAAARSAQQSQNQGGGNNSNLNSRPKFHAPNSSGQFNNGGFNVNNNPFFTPNRPQNFVQPNFPQQNFPQQNFRQDNFQPQFAPSRTVNSSFAPQVAITPAAPTYSNLPIVLRCSSSASGQCSYRLTEASGASYPYTITPGRKQVFNETTTWELSLDRGDGQSLRYTLNGGEIYEIRQENGLWVCYCAS